MRTKTFNVRSVDWILFYLKTSRSNTSERAEFIKKLVDFKAEKEELLKLLEAYKDSDPDVIAQEKLETQVGIFPDSLIYAVCGICIVQIVLLSRTPVQ